MALALGRLAFAAVFIALVLAMARFVNIGALLGKRCHLRAIAATPINQDLVLLTRCHN